MRQTWVCWGLSYVFVLQAWEDGDGGGMVGWAGETGCVLELRCDPVAISLMGRVQERWLVSTDPAPRAHRYSMH